VADEDVLMEMRHAHADDGGKHEVGVQLGAQAGCGSPHCTTDCFGLGVGEVGQIRHVPASLNEQISEYGRASSVDGAMGHQHELVFPYLWADQWTLTAMLGADRAVAS
jgi:hypothetical protein